MRRKGRVVQIITEAKKRNGDKVFLATWKKLPGRGATNPRNRMALKSGRGSRSQSWGVENA